MTGHAQLDVERLLNLHAEGLSAREIAARMGVTPRSVQRRRRQFGLSVVPSQPMWGPASPERLAEAAQLIADGCSHAEVSRTLRMKRETLVRHFPGTQWSRAESVEFAVLAKRLRNLGPRLPMQVTEKGTK